MPDPRATIPLTPGDDPAAVGRLAAAPAAEADVPIRFAQPSVEQQLGGIAGSERYEVRGTLGVGATGQVLAVYDRDLQRDIAVKVLRESDRGERTGEFLGEARTTAGLSHPNVLPVLDLHLSADGRPCFSMARIDGTTLADAIAASSATGRDERLRTPNAVVTIFIAVSHAIRYAHSRGIIHQDLKPENILLGGFGEVVVLDWGSAGRVGDDGRLVSRLYGTPLYMSPEQARGSHAERRSDVYGLGATLFHALTLRPPTWDDAPAVFWAKKTEGVIDPLTDAERRAVPAPLVSIAMAAMHPDPDRRYASVAAMTADLERYQAGLAVSVHRDPLRVVLRRWYAANRRLTWSMLAASVALLAMAALLAHEKAKERTRWKLVLEERFDGPLEERWRAVARPWTSERSHEVALDDATHFPPIPGAKALRAGHGWVNLVYRWPVLGDVRVEWDVMAKTRAVNMNCFLQGTDRVSGYTFHVGHQADPSSVVLTRGAGVETLVRHRLAQPLQPDRTYRFMMEQEGVVVRLSIDGATCIEYHDLDAETPSSGTFGFDAVEWHFPLIVDNVRVYHKPLAQRITAIAYARSLMQMRQYAHAYAQFADILAEHGDGDLGPQALHGMATCSVRQGRQEHAVALLDDFARR